MQAYLPLTSAELLDAAPPQRPPLFPQCGPGQASSAEELEEAREEAALRSLVLAREDVATPTRLVAGGDLAPGAEFTTWQQVDELYVDDVRGRDLARALFAAQTQQEADNLMGELFAEPLMWYDISERQSLGDALVGSEAVNEV